MAFKILSEEKLDLLTDNQRRQYEKELEIYNKRVAFAAQLEKYENIEFEPYKPKLKPITIIKQTEFKAYQNREYKAQLQEPIKKPELQVHFVEITKPANIDLPRVSVPAAEAKSITIEKNQPILPSVTKPVVAVLTFTLTESKQRDLPVFAKPRVAVVAFKKPEKSLIELPLVEKPIVESLLFTDGLKISAKKTPSNIPSIIVPSITVPAFAAPEKKSPYLPIVSFTAPATKSFSKPEQKAAELPAFPKSEITFKQINIEGVSMRQLPQTRKANMSVKSYVRPEIPVSSLPDIAKPSIAAASFQPPKIDRVKLPTTVIKSVVPKEIRPIKLERHSVTAPKVPVIAVKSFARFETKCTGVPKLKKTIIPNPRETLERFFSISNDKTDVIVGQNI